MVNAKILQVDFCCLSVLRLLNWKMCIPTVDAMCFYWCFKLCFSHVQLKIYCLESNDFDVWEIRTVLKMTESDFVFNFSFFHLKKNGFSNAKNFPIQEAVFRKCMSFFWNALVS